MGTSTSAESSGDQPFESLANFSEDDLEKLYAAGGIQQFSPGDVVLAEGDADSSVYIVLEGQAEVAVPRKQGWFQVATLVPGSVFGELSFFDRMARSARVPVTQDCTVLKISEDSFQQLVAQDTRMALAFVMELSKVMSRRLRRMNRLMQALVK